MTRFSTQRGNTLIVSIIMLALLSLVAVMSVNQSNTSIQIAGNLQFQEEATAAAQQAIETIVTKTAYLTSKFTDTTNPPAAQSISITATGSADYTVTFDPVPKCKSYAYVDLATEVVPDVCYGTKGIPLCYWAIWDVSAKANDPRTSAQATVHQGVKMLTGQADALTACP